MEEGKRKYFGIVFALILATLVVFAGCVAKPESSSSGSSSGELEDGSDDRLETDRTKSGYEETETSLSNAIKDGFYTSLVNYDSPGGLDTMNVSVSIKDGKVATLTLDVVKAGDISTNYIKNMNTAIPPLVVGKSLDQISLPKQISGSSLTSVAVAKYFEGLKAQ